MKTAVVDFKKCGGAHCTKCPAARACDRRLIVKVDFDEPAVIDTALCSGCGDCVSACLHSAIKLVEV